MWQMGKRGWQHEEVPREESDFYSLIGNMKGWEAPTSHFSIIMACLVMYAGLKQVVEIGVWKGGTSILLAQAVKVTGGSYVGVDVNIEQARERVVQFGLDEVCSFLEGRSDQVEYTGALIDLLFIDGDHTKEGVRADWDRWVQWVRPGGWIFIDNTVSQSGVIAFFKELQQEEAFRRDFRFVNCQASFGVAVIQRKLREGL